MQSTSDIMLKLTKSLFTKLQAALHLDFMSTFLPATFGVYLPVSGFAALHVR
jgi:hypothetical protein